MTIPERKERRRMKPKLNSISLNNKSKETSLELSLIIKKLKKITKKKVRKSNIELKLI